MRNIDLIREVTSAAAGNWPYVLAGLSIDVPDSSRRHAPCPACGGKDVSDSTTTGAVALSATSAALATA
jgi:phage/plasmid primase-like uncharacterized protein